MEPQTATTSETRTPATRGKVGRHDPCPCGSGRKLKKCCLFADRAGKGNHKAH